MARHLSNDEFFLRIADLFGECQKKDHGSISLTQKRIKVDQSADAVSSSPSTDPFPDLHPAKPLPIIIKATNGKSKDNKKHRVKFSTVVEADALESFFQRYAEACKAGMVGLKKRDRSKTKAKQKAKKKKDGTVLEEVKTTTG